MAESSLDPGSSYVTVGAYNHGGQYGVTKYTSEAPELTKKLTELLQLDFPSESFTSATLVKNTYMPTHKDECNDKDYRNLVSPLKVTEGAGVSEEMKAGDVFAEHYQEMQVKGVATPGQVHSLKAPVTVNPKRWHCAVQGNEGPRLLLVGHTIGSWRKLKPHMVSELEDCGFALPVDDPDVLLRSASEVSQQVQHYTYETEEDDMIQDFHTFDGIAEVEQDIVRAAKAAAENLYTPNVEKILTACEAAESELRVVHTVHPAEVERNLEKWVERG